MIPTIPHISAVLLPALFRDLGAAARAKLGGELRLHHLLAAADGKRVGGHLLGDGAAGADISTGAHRHGRHEGNIGADEGAGADVGAKLLEAIVIASDRAGADVGAGTDRTVA